MWENFAECMEDFIQRSNREEKTMNYMQKRLGDLGMKDVQHVLSVGPGSAIIDAPLVKMMPMIETYTAVEPNEKFSQLTRKKMEDLFPKKDAVTIYNGILESYPGPNNPMDLILLVQVVYYFDNFEKEMQRILSWIKPGGKAIIIVAKSSSIWNTYENVRRFQIGSEDVKKKLVNMDLKFTEEAFDHQMDMTHPGKTNYGFISICVDRPATEAEVEKYLATLEKQFIPGTKKINKTQIMFILEKQ